MTQQVPHYFLAVPLSEETRSFLTLWAEQHQDELFFKQWVHPQDYHITLAFLGKAPFQQMKELKQSVSEAAAPHRPFSLEINRPGTFGKKERPRIFFAGTAHSDALLSLHNDVYSACESVGFVLDRRPYRPHLTIAKKWTGSKLFDPNRINDFVNRDGSPTWRVNEIVLYQTHLNRTPKYQPLKRFPLTGTAE